MPEENVAAMFTKKSSKIKMFHKIIKKKRGKLCCGSKTQNSTKVIISSAQMHAQNE
jgi:hypothetical protein